MKSKHFLFWVALCCSILSTRAQVTYMDSATAVYDSLSPYVSTGILLERNPEFIYAGTSDYNPIYYAPTSDSLGIERKFIHLYNLMYYASFSDSIFKINPSDLDSIIEVEYYGESRNGKTTEQLLSITPTVDIMLGFMQTGYEYIGWEMDTNNYYSPIILDTTINKYLLNAGNVTYQDSIIIDTTYYDPNLDTTVVIDTAYLMTSTVNYDVDSVLQRLFQQQEMLILSTLVNNRVCVSLNEKVTFKIPSNLVFTSPSCMFICKELHIDFDDGNGPVPVVPDSIYEVTYSSYGTKTLRSYVYNTVTQEYLYPAASPTKIHLTKCVLGKDPDASITNPEFNPCNVPDGGYGTGESVTWIKYKKNGTQKITKPVILVEGFESGKFDKQAGPEYDKGSVNGFGDINWKSLTSGSFPSYAQQLSNLPYFADSMRNIGYDILFFDLRTNRAKIQKNANSLINLIQYVNAVLDSNGSDEEIIVIAPSMGGIISRYAIRKMELHDCCHNIRLWFSFNGQHHGATIPLGLQEMLWALGTDFNPPERDGVRQGDAAKDTYLNVMNAPVTRQLLVYHREPTAINDHNQLYSELDSMGYPEYPRIFALISGSDEGKGLNSNPDDLNSPLLQGGTKVLEMDFKVTAPVVFPDLFVFPILTFNNLKWNSPQATDNWTLARAQAYSVLHDPGATVNQMFLERGRYIRGNINHLVLGQGGIYVAGLVAYTTNIIIHSSAIAAAAPGGCFPCLAFEASKHINSLIISGATTTALLANWGINEAINNDPQWDVKHQFSSLNYDGAPGDYNDALRRVAELSNGLIKAHFGFHTFSPSVSCLGIDTNDLFINIAANKGDLIKYGIIPFEDYHANKSGAEGQSENQPHVNITGEVIDWVLEKIRFTEVNAIKNNIPSKTLNEYYNFGRPFDNSDPNVFHAIPEKEIGAINVTNGGELFINKYDSVAFRFNHYFPTEEFVDFNIQTKNGLCDSSYVRVKNGGLFTIGDTNYIQSQGTIINNRANVIFIENSFLEIETGGTLRINENSSLIIEKGAQIILHPGAIIELDGENSVLEIKGKTVLKENAIFTFTGDGFIRFAQPMTSSTLSQYWDIEGNNEIHINGSGLSDKKMEILETLIIPETIDSCYIDSNLIQIAEGKRLNILSSLYLHDNLITSLDTLNPAHSVTLFGQEYASIKGNYFHKLQIGLNANLITFGNDLTVEDCEFTKNEDGVVSTGWGMHFISCELTDNSKNGWKAQDVSTTSTAVGSNFNNNGDDGITINSASTASILSLYECELNQNDYGISSTAIDLRMGCTEAKTNSVAGIYSVDGMIDLDSNAGNWITGNSNGIIIENCDQLLLKDGHNQFSNTNYDIYGDFTNSATTSLYYDDNLDTYFLDVFDNSIPSSSPGLLDIFMTIDYNNNDTVGVINWTANTRIAGTTCMPPATANYYLGVLGGKTGRIINTTNYINTDFIAAIKNAESYVSDENSIGDDLLGITLLKEILDAPLVDPSPTSDEQIATDIAYQLMLKALGNAYDNNALELNRAEGGSSEDPYLLMVIDEIDTRLANIDPTDEFAYEETYELSLQKAHMYRLSEHYDYAYDILTQVEEWSSAEDLFNTQYWACVVQNEEAYIDEQITFEEFEGEIENCREELPELKMILSPIPGKTTPIRRSELENIAHFTLQPNPTSDRTTLHFSMAVEGQVQINIFNSAASLIHSFRSNMYGTKMNIETSTLKSGVYYVEVLKNGKSLGVQKLIVE